MNHIKRTIYKQFYLYEIDPTTANNKSIKTVSDKYIKLDDLTKIYIQRCDKQLLIITIKHNGNMHQIKTKKYFYNSYSKTHSTLQVFENMILGLFVLYDITKTPQIVLLYLNVNDVMKYIGSKFGIKQLLYSSKEMYKHMFNHLSFNIKGSYYWNLIFYKQYDENRPKFLRIYITENIYDINQ